MTRRLILEQWNRFRRESLPADASRLQVESVRLTFYAGAISLFDSVIETLTSESEPTEADLAQMRALRDEILSFKTDVLARGRGKLSHG
jgi:hypothetical protein